MLLFLVLRHSDAGNIRRNHHRVVRVVNNESRLCTGYLFNLFFFYIIDFDFFLIASGGVVGGKTCGFFEGCVRKLFSAGFYDDMRTRSALCMEPPVVADSKLKGQFLILQVVLTDIHGKTIAADIVERTACDFYLFGTAFSAAYGVVTSVKVIKDRETGKSKGFAFVEMENDAEAAQAMNELNGSEFMGRQLVIKEARPRD